MQNHFLILFSLIACTGAFSGQETIAAELTPQGDVKHEKIIVRREEVSEADVLEDDTFEGVTTTPYNYWEYFEGLTNITASNRSEQASKNLALLCLLILVGSLLFYVLCFYFLTSKDKDIEMTTWKVLSGAVSLGCTSMLFQAWRLFAYLSFSQTMVTSNAMLGISYGRLLGAMLIFPWIIMRFWYSPIGLEAASEIAGNFIGFAAIDAFGGILRINVFQENPGYLALLIQGYILAFIALMFGAALLRGKFWATGLWNYAPDILPWKKKVECAEDQAFGLTIGLFLSMLVRFLISGTLPDVGGTPSFHSREEVRLLLVACGISALVTVFVAGGLSYMKQPVWGTIGYRVANCVTLMCEMCTAWLIFFFFQWKFWWTAHLTGTVGGSEVDELVAQMGVTVLAYCTVFAVIFFLDKIADILRRPRDSALRDVNSSLSLLLGFSWQMTIYITIKGYGIIQTKFADQCWAELQLLLLVNLILLPAWIRLMVPKLVSVEKEYEQFTNQRDTMNAEKKLALTAMKKKLAPEPAAPTAEASSATAATPLPVNEF